MITLNLIFERENGTTLILRLCKRRGCGKWVVVSRWNRKKVFCTEQCKIDHHNGDGFRLKKYGSVDPDPVPCLFCGGPISMRRPGWKLYDSRLCRDKHKRIQKSGAEPVENCEVCDKKLRPITKRRHDQTVCGKKCMLARNRQKHSLKKLHKDEKSGKAKKKTIDELVFEDDGPVQSDCTEED